ncbi:MFS transporter [Eggerthella sp. YY7918]|uniref:MFS transporter n=1 Tax=Eggerthella sp. (strain YY7918) TaxID=502558 RepID=UPI00021710F5|nr:MFS transporter [Eggerthella sp. YY7918]BAK43546.1 hypothetical protein EGYY_03130 [Eggerthella sp. YY7918]
MGTQTKGSNYAWAVAIACVAFYAVPLGFAANHAGLFITPVMDQFGWSRTDATLFMSLQPWVAAICTPIAGKLISKYNPRWIMTAAVLAFGLANLACAWFTEPWQWHIYGIIYGASAAFWMYIATPTFVNRWFAKSNGTVIGTIGVMVSLLGAIMSPVIQGWITSMGWQTARIICSVIVIVLGAGVTALLLRESPEKMGVLPWGYSEAEAEASKSETKATIDVANDEGATAAQARRSPALWLLIVMAGFFVISASFVQQLASYASVTEGLGAAVGAMAVSVAMVTSMAGKFGLGWISDHFGARAAGITAGVLGAAGAFICFIGGANVMMFYVGVGLFGIGYSALNVVPPMTCRQAFGQKDYANVFSIVATGLNVFSGFSALIYAQIFDITGSFAGAFWMIIVFYVVIVFLSLVIVPMGRKIWAK